MAGICVAEAKLAIEKAFILRFKTLPVLWDTSNPYYTNKYKRMEALSKLLPVLRKIKPDATLYEVRKKINSLRSNYRRELRKVIMSQSAGGEEVYCPRGWSFRYLSFLGTLDEPGQEIQYHEMSDEEVEEIVISQDQNDIESEITLETSMSPVSLSPPPTPRNSKKAHRDLQQLYKYEYSTVPGPQDYSPMVLEWVNTLDRLDPMQRLYAKKAINDILFEAELGNLSRHSVKINETVDVVVKTSSPPPSSSTLL